MVIHRKITFFIALALIFSTACVKQLPAPEQPTQTPVGLAASSPVATGVMDTIFLIATQTAMAAQGAPGAVVLPSADASGVAPTLPVLTPLASGVPATAAQPTPVPSGPQPTLLVPTSYVIHKGEHPYCLGRRFNINPADIMAANGLNPSTASSLSVGTKLVIPQNGRPFGGNRALQPHPASYTVSGGDTIYTIACYFGDVAPETIIWANNLVDPYKLTAGQVLNIP
jgi:LysM repeat protein